MNNVELQKRILTWYAQNKRALPWRTTTDPYHVLVAEVMLQQTQVDRVIPKYRAFLQAFPTISDLADAPLSNVLEFWSGLGYNNRAVRLWEAVKMIKEKYDGKVPSNRGQLLALPGIGPYTADAILSFAFNLPYPCVDTNIRRVLIHELKLPESIPATTLYNIAVQQIPKGKSREWNNALMDYGAIVLTAKKTGIKPLTQQSKFLHSRRWYRGQIMKLLVQKKTIGLNDLIRYFKKDEDAFKDILKELQRDKLVLWREKNIYLP